MSDTRSDAPVLLEIILVEIEVLLALLLRPYLICVYIKWGNLFKMCVSPVSNYTFFCVLYGVTVPLQLDEFLPCQPGQWKNYTYDSEQFSCAVVTKAAQQSRNQPQ